MSDGGQGVPDPVPSSAPSSGPSGSSPAPEAVKRRSRLSLIWLIPLVAAAIAAYLGFQTVSRRGPMVTVTWQSAQGLTAGQTKVRHKAVDLGTVQTITLAPDMSHVIVALEMTREAAPYLTQSARFWVVRPRLSASNISGLDTLVSGSYIEMDPGDRAKPALREFTGLEQPPGVRSDEPGHTYTLKAARLGSITSGTPVLFRDIQVGEVLSYDLGDGMGPVTLQVFVRAPFDKFVREGTHFWNASGITVALGAEGVHVELSSLQTVLGGGLLFDTPQDPQARVAAENSEFALYESYSASQSARYATQFSFVSYFDADVGNLARNAPVELYGIQVGIVRDISLEIDTQAGTARARVRYDIQPDRIMSHEAAVRENVETVTRRMVAHGLRAELKTASYVTGQLVLSMQYVPNAGPADVRKEGDDIVIPSQGGGFDNILTAVSDFSAKLQRLPLDQIGSSLNTALASASGALGGVEGLVKRTDAGLAPTLKSLPQLTAQLQDAVARAGRVFGSLDASYGSNSSFNRELERALDQIGDAGRSIRVLADFLERHPEALVRGRAGISP